MKTGPRHPAQSQAAQRRAVDRDRRLHQRRQVESAQRADRRRCAGARTRCSPPSNRPRAAGEFDDGAPVRAHRHRRVRPASAAPSSSRRSARRWRRSSTPTCWCTSSTVPTPTRWHRSMRCGPVVREVVAEHDGQAAPELLVVNKIDATTDLAMAKLRRALPGAVFVSAHTGDGLDELRRRMAELAVPADAAIDVVIPYRPRRSGGSRARRRAGDSNPSTTPTALGSGRGFRWRWPRACVSSRRPNLLSRRRRPRRRPSPVAPVELSAHPGGILPSRCGCPSARGR